MIGVSMDGHGQESPGEEGMVFSAGGPLVMEAVPLTLILWKVLVSVAPLVEEARERIIDGMTVAEHEADSKVRRDRTRQQAGHRYRVTRVHRSHPLYVQGIPDHIVVKLLTER